MTSLTEAYDGSAGGTASPGRLYAGTALVLLGAVLAVVAVLTATTDLFSATASALSPGIIDHLAAVRMAGILAGLGVPTALVGVFLVLPASRRVHAAAAISVSLCLLGVVLFWDAYPQDWRTYGEDHTLRVSAIYLLGLFTAVWSLFTAIVNFKTRNDPGGALEMNVTRHNQTVVEVAESNTSSGFGGIGFFGGKPDGDVETQTNTTEPDDEPSDSSRSVRRSTVSSDSETGTGPARARTPGVATSDGGTAASDLTSPNDASGGRDAEIVESESERSPSDEPTDRYCGNCSHFEYVRSSGGMVPYCALQETAMDDMDACEEWTPNNR
ncbi:tripartite tricarboxylate transporter TctB family protein [Natronorubrum halophilum]|uniref:tripartite tricarboxylate transporter TctB family protein n=1 Tax=Natronorubrum halophilum TaxID=1702106 RepID=UPI000EF6D15A|nr:tripartite tricarboxylate transporter TctB family protein [Natronorubrum halophilum]